ncbi:Cell division protein DivIC (FtsB), stabilizes FtsL against RasP cleavage [Pediococcus damnosus]|uniref:FtsB family cell division protein n=1 Tax=Pediococcus damnosus TaxID=51663 RepID=UPI00078C7A87|nr:septum formation initiator family protein [Pediococcus damnosus]AMV69732.1 Cell division protein DivIC (FtsB), stabilizes FtsL against RasP cleavage [Pediococcus damnosus]
MVSNVNDIKKQNTIATEKISKIRTARLHRFYIIMGIFIVFAGILSFQLIHTHYERAQVEQQISTSKKHYTTAKNQNETLDVQVKQLNNDNYLQKLLREKYYYSKSGEIIYSLPSDHSEDVSQK